MPVIDPSRDKYFGANMLYTVSDKEVAYRALWLKQNETDRQVDLDLRNLLTVLLFEPHPSCWERGAFSAATSEYQAALLKLARIIHKWTGIEVMHRRLIVQQVTRCRANQTFTLIVYEPIRRVTRNGAICRHVYKYELEFTAC
jgi:hypothetical protein